MKNILFLFLLLLGYEAVAQTSYSTAIASYEVIVSKDMRNAFQPHSEDGASNSFFWKYRAKGAAVPEKDYYPLDAVLTDTCIALLRQGLKTKKIQLDYRIPKGKNTSYTAYGYPNVSLAKAARIATNQAYIKMEVKFAFKESVTKLDNDLLVGLRMTPHVSITITLADAEGKTIYDAEGAATATSSTGNVTISDKLFSMQKDNNATITRADDEARGKLLVDLFSQALTETLFNIYH